MFWKLWSISKLENTFIIIWLQNNLKSWAKSMFTPSSENWIVYILPHVLTICRILLKSPELFKLKEIGGLPDMAVTPGKCKMQFSLELE